MIAVPKRYKLQYLPLIWDDLNSAVTYISEVLHNPQAARDLLSQTEASILKHLESPTTAVVYKTTKTRPLPYYWFPVGNYMIFYVVFDDVMEVRRMVYGA